MSGKPRLRNWFWVEIVLGSATAILAIITAIWHEWIEIIFGVDPDSGNGALEWGIVTALAAATVLLGLLARAEWKHAMAGAAE